METSQSRRNVRRQRGFTLIETMIAIMILTIGLVGVAALITQAVSMSAHARYVSTAALLASEKLEDLNRFPSSDPHLVAGGSLGADQAGYSDQVQISSNNGTINEVTTAAGVSTLYTQQPTGNVTVNAGAALPAATPDMLTFDRRWTVVANTPVAGVRQITVLVTLNNISLKPQVTFQTSMVHP